MAREFVMSDGEISNSYRLAADKNEQLSVLADLNVCSPAEMAEKLRELGFEVADVGPKKRSYHKLNTEEAMKLYRAGLTQKQIAEALGVSVTTVQSWWARERLGRHGQPKKTKEATEGTTVPPRWKQRPPKLRTPPQKTKAMPLARVIEVLTMIRELHPDAVLQVVDAGKLSDLSRIVLRQTFGATGPAETYVDLEVYDHGEKSVETDEKSAETDEKEAEADGREDKGDH